MYNAVFHRIIEKLGLERILRSSRSHPHPSPPWIVKNENIKKKWDWFTSKKRVYSQYAFLTHRQLKQSFGHISIFNSMPKYFWNTEIKTQLAVPSEFQSGSHKPVVFCSLTCYWCFASRTTSKQSERLPPATPALELHTTSSRKSPIFHIPISTVLHSRSCLCRTHCQCNGQHILSVTIVTLFIWVLPNFVD